MLTGSEIENNKSVVGSESPTRYEEFDYNVLEDEWNHNGEFFENDDDNYDYSAYDYEDLEVEIDENKGESEWEDDGKC